MPDVLATRQRMAAFADGIRSGQGARFHRPADPHVVNIGIGGSDLGPKMLAYALRSVSHPAVGVHYVSNLDSAQLAPLLQTLDPRTTLFLVASKTFTTQETMLNAQTARDWLLAKLGDAAAVSSHFAALTAKPERAVQFGIREDAVFPLWDWVGGRFSLWSAVGLALMIAIGPQAFAELLAGAERMDEHFRSTPYERNLPVVMALIGIWNTNFLGATSNAVLPYNESLKYFPSFLQQLEMESNGKVGRQRWAAAGLCLESHRLGRARQQWPARLLPAAAPGRTAGALRFHRCRSRRLSAARTPGSAARQLLRAERGAGLRQDGCRGAQRTRGHDVSGSARGAAAAQGVCRAISRHRRCC
jgi:glucose-6-phosphate isomerase